MREIHVEGTKFYYFLADDGISEIEATGLSVTTPDTAVVSAAREAVDVRLAVFRRILQPGRGDVYFLFWNNEQNLTIVDQRVAAGSATDDDFTASVKTTHQLTVCERCRSWWSTLIIPPGDPYPGAPGLMERKIAASRILLCPKCGSSFRQMVVKIFGRADGRL